MASVVTCRPVYILLIEQQKLSMQLEKEKLEQVALQVKQRSKDIEEMVMVSVKKIDFMFLISLPSLDISALGTTALICSHRKQHEHEKKGKEPWLIPKDLKWTKALGFRQFRVNCKHLGQKKSKSLR